MEAVNSNDRGRISSFKVFCTSNEKVPIESKMQIFSQGPAQFKNLTLPKGRRLIQQVHEPNQIKVKCQRAGFFYVGIRMGYTELDTCTIHKIRSSRIRCS